MMTGCLPPVFRYDIIVSGHSHTKLDQPKKVNDTIIVQSGEYAQAWVVLK